MAHNIKGTLALPHAYGWLQFGEDLELFFRTLIGYGVEPQCGSLRGHRYRAVLDGRVVDGIAKTGQAGRGLFHRRNGDITTIANASRKARELMQWASEQQREKCSIEELFISTKCGESDTTSGLASCPTVGNLIDKLDPMGVTTCFGEPRSSRAPRWCAPIGRPLEVRGKFMQVFNAYQEVINRHKTSDLSESQPTKGNIAGGLTTIEEKRLGTCRRSAGRAGSSTCSNRRKRPREARASITWTRRRPQRNASPFRPRPVSSFIFFRPGRERHRQPDRAGHQAHREPEDRPDDGGTY